MTLATEMPDVVELTEPFQMVYRWTPGDSLPDNSGDYICFVHFLDPDGRVVEQDDHEPPVPTSMWRPGQAVEYERWFRFMGPDVYDYVDVIIGFYDPDSGRVAVRSGGRWETEVHASRIHMENSGYEGAPMPGDGWYQLERSETSRDLWHWMKDEATVIFANPRRDSLLHMEASAPVSLLGRPQPVKIFLHDVAIASFSISDDERFRLRIPVGAQDLGEDGFVEFRIQVEHSVVPSEVLPDSESRRALGLKVFYLHLGPR